jgi:hypothetical protein
MATGVLVSCDVVSAKWVVAVTGRDGAGSHNPCVAIISALPILN